MVRANKRKLDDYSKQIRSDGEQAKGFEQDFNQKFRSDDKLVKDLQEKETLADEERKRLAEERRIYGVFSSNN